MFFMLFSCISSHHILTLADGGNAEQKQKNAQELVQIIENTESTHHYYFAAETAGKLKVPNIELEKKLTFLLSSRSHRPEVRAKAAWALGEIRNMMAPTLQARSSSIPPSAVFIMSCLVARP